MYIYVYINIIYIYIYNFIHSKFYAICTGRGIYIYKVYYVIYIYIYKYIYIYIVYYVIYTCAVLGRDDEISERAHIYTYIFI
jgi:hypothetical protein